jgi:hypothetical protein
LESFDDVKELGLDPLKEFYEKNPMMEKDSRCGRKLKNKKEEKVKTRKTKKKKYVFDSIFSVLIFLIYWKFLELFTFAF